MREYEAYHDDPPCTAKLLPNGRCPQCNIVPDMQSIILKKKESRATHGPDNAWGWAESNGNDKMLRHIAMLEERYSKLEKAARAVVYDHERLCSTWQKCSHNVHINKLKEVLEEDK